MLLTLIINGSTAQLLLSLFGMDALSKSEVKFCNLSPFALRNLPAQEIVIHVCPFM